VPNNPANAVVVGTGNMRVGSIKQVRKLAIRYRMKYVHMG
jgi:hypothetical protein